MLLVCFYDEQKRPPIVFRKSFKELRVNDGYGAVKFDC